MTTYGPEELTRDWEFKIVRANRPVFRNPAHLRRLVEQEGRAGWTLLEKFDNSRIRFKRPIQARLNDRNLPPGIDPYRVHYGLHPGAFAALVALFALAAAAAIVLTVYVVVNGLV